MASTGTHGDLVPPLTIDAGPYTAPLSMVDRADLDRAGGKGANLGELVRAGFPVPAGFVVLTAAYDHLLGRSGLGQQIPDLLPAEADGDEIDGAPIRQAILDAEMPPEVAEAVRVAYRSLGQGPVAVRSSATAEDLPEAAFAGQQDTELNIVGEEALVEAVRRCWASLWTDRAIAYRRRRQMEPTAARIAVVVQRMAAAETAGVMFTVNPVSGARDEVVIDASPGLGEAVVSGLVTPDHIVIGKRARHPRIKEYQRGQREVIIRALEGGGTEHITAAGATTEAVEPALTEDAVRRLVHLGIAIEQHFGSPQDIEWAWAQGQRQGQALILQARPIAALPDPPPRPNRRQRRTAGIFAEMLPVRPYPLDVTTWTGALLDAAFSVFTQLGMTGVSAEQLLVERDGVVVGLSLPRVRPSVGSLTALPQVVRRARRHDPVVWRSDPQLAEIETRARALQARDLQTLSWPELLATLQDALAVLPLMVQLRVRYFPAAALALVRLRALLGLLGRSDRLQPLLSGTPTKTAETNHALETLAATIRGDRFLAETFASHDPADLRSALAAQPPGHAFLADFDRFLLHYGHRETATPLLATQPTWKDAPQVVLGLLKGMALTPSQGRTEQQDGKGARDDLLTHPLLRWPPLRWIFPRLRDTASRALQIREDTHFYATMALPTVHRTILELGRRLAAAGVLDSSEDVFHLKLDDLTRVGDPWPPPPQLAHELAELARARKAARAALGDKPLLDPRLFTSAAAGGPALLRGVPASPGVAKGPARVLTDASQFSQLRAGDVLVAPYTNPAWTPLFQRAAAVVVDTGGAGSHAAIVAREYGIPAVVATGEATRLLTDGQRILVDGNQGLVLPADEQDQRPPA